MSTARPMNPESLMMSYGYKPELSEGSLKCPIFATSTFVFKSALDGKRFFELAYGLRDADAGEELGLIYSRLNNPDLEILENRLKLWDNAEDCAVFESGMAAISTLMLEFLKPGMVLLHSAPLYGGTHHFIRKVLPAFGITNIEFESHETEDEIMAKVEAAGAKGKIGLVYIETPCNPTNAIIDLEMVANLGRRLSSDDLRVFTACDNTYMGPMWQRPLKFGIDIAVYSATKFIGGHSDVIAGSVSGSKEAIGRLKVMRTFLGNMAGPWTGWLLMRSLETLKVRTDCMARNAAKVAQFLLNHPKVTLVRYLGFAEPGSRQAMLRDKQCDCNGSMISFEIDGKEADVFRFLDSLKLVHLAVSLGGTESLAEHPASMTHCDVSPEDRIRTGISESLVRLSVGVENADDLIWDLGQALDAV